MVDEPVPVPHAVRNPYPEVIAHPGPPGPQGIPGRDGVQGPAGLQGPVGLPGERGLTGNKAVLWNGCVELSVESVVVVTLPYNGSINTLRGVEMMVDGQGQCHSELRDGARILATLDSGLDGVTILSLGMFQGLVDERRVLTLHMSVGESDTAKVLAVEFTM